MDNAALFLLVGTLVFVLYMVLQSVQSEMDDLESPTVDCKKRTLEYTTLNSEVGRRGDLLASHGRIFVAAIFVLLGIAGSIKETRVILIYSTLVIYSIFLFFNVLPTKQLDNIALARLRGIENQNEFEVHKYMRESIKGNKMVALRRLLWALFLEVFVVIGYLLLTLPQISAS